MSRNEPILKFSFSFPNFPHNCLPFLFIGATNGDDVGCASCRGKIDGAKICANYAAMRDGDGRNCDKLRPHRRA